MIILYPTDTVYGLGVDATDVEEVRALRALKGREEGKYFPVIISDLAMARSYAMFTPLAERLVVRFWPGALSLVLESTLFPEELTCGTGTIAVRMPDHPVALALVKEFGKPITSTSANSTGMPTPSTTEEILLQFGEKAKLITRVIDGGVLPPSKPSTVVDARGEMPIVIRAGAISEVAILEALR